MELATTYLAEEVSFVLTFEGIGPTQHYVEDDTQGPNICGKSTIVFLLDYLRSHIRWCTTEDLKPLVLATANTKSEIDKLDVASVVNENVFELQVPVTNVHSM